MEGQEHGPNLLGKSNTLHHNSGLWLSAKETWPLYIAISFGLFGLSHLLTLLGLREALTGFLIAIRTIAYLLVAFTLYLAAFKK